MSKKKLKTNESRVNYQSKENELKHDKKQLKANLHEIWKQ